MHDRLLNIRRTHHHRNASIPAHIFETRIWHFEVQAVVFAFCRPLETSSSIEVIVVISESADLVAEAPAKANFVAVFDAHVTGHRSNTLSTPVAGFIGASHGGEENALLVTIDGQGNRLEFIGQGFDADEAVRSKLEKLVSEGQMNCLDATHAILLGHFETPDGMHKSTIAGSTCRCEKEDIFWWEKSPVYLSRRSSLHWILLYHLQQHRSPSAR